MSKDYEIVVVDTVTRPFPPAKRLVQAGVPVSVAARWAQVRRELSPTGLKRQLKDRQN